MKIKRVLMVSVMIAAFFISVAAFAAKCPQCGYNNKDNAKFCVKCGAAITAEGVLKKEKMSKVSSNKLSAVRKTIAVASFKNASGVTGYVNLGNDFSTQLTDALIQSDKFIVVSRTELGSVLTEQDLAESGRLAKSLSAKKGKVIPAQILITGKITEFEAKAGQESQGINIKGFKLGAKKSHAHIGVIVQIVDSTTAQVLDSQRVEGRADASGFDIGFSGSFGINTSDFKKTPLGKATQIAIDKAVVYIANKLSQIPWEGKVVTVKSDLVYINAGSEAGIGQGDQFNIYRPGEALIDPDTGIDLGSEKTHIATVEVVDAQPKFSKAKVVLSNDLIERGNIVLGQ